MAKKKRVTRSTSDLRAELVEQVSLLKHACDSYDNGLEAIGKHIALSLRVLLHHHGQSQALLVQLGLRGKRFPNSTGIKLSPTNLMSDCPLTIIKASTTKGGGYLPLISAGGSPYSPIWEKFEDWWNVPILKDSQNRTFNRREIILNVANTDGGGHVDPTLEEKYMDLSRHNSLGWEFHQDDVVKKLKGKPHLSCARQIAHEVTESLVKYAPWATS